MVREAGRRRTKRTPFAIVVGIDNDDRFLRPHFDDEFANLQLLPKVNGAAAGALIVANGFSCREQIEDLGGRETLHLAEVLVRGTG